MEGSGGYGAGPAAHLTQRSELVVELDRPDRLTRKAGAKSDPIDAVRAARDALARTHLAQPRIGAERAALQVLLTSRRAAVDATVDAQSQLHALVVTAPEQVRARFRGLSTRGIIATALKQRSAHYAADVHVFTAMTTLKAIARRVRPLEDEAAEHEKAIRTIVSSRFVSRAVSRCQSESAPICRALEASYRHSGTRSPCHRDLQ
jgi:transposase